MASIGGSDSYHYKYNNINKSKHKEQVKEYFENKPPEIYKYVSSGSTSSFIEKVNQFIHDNPDYEKTEDFGVHQFTMYFKLKEDTTKPKTTVKD